MPSGMDDELTVTRALTVVSDLPRDAGPDAHAAAAGLTYVEEDDLGIVRIRCGRGFTYRYPDGTTVPQGSADRERIERLAIPPAWTDVRICLDADGHVQATGVDDAGRKQYRYHERWRGIRDATKFHRMSDFVRVLPRVRDTVDRHLRKRGHAREKMLALLVALLDETLIRIGNDRYARTNGAYGLTTLLGEHVEVDGARVRFAFPGKSGQEQELELHHRRLASQLLRCEEIPGQRMFAYQQDDAWREIQSGDVNDYLREIAGDDVTAKDFRTWGATVVAAAALRDLPRPETTREVEANVLAAIDVAAERLGNTRAVARSSYVDPRVPKAYRFGRFEEAWDRSDAVKRRLSPAERAVTRLLDLELPPSAELVGDDA